MGNSYDKSGQFVERGLGYRRGLIGSSRPLPRWSRCSLGLGPQARLLDSRTKSSKAVARPTRAWAI